MRLDKVENQKSTVKSSRTKTQACISTLVFLPVFLLFSCKHAGFSNDHLPPSVMQKVLLDVNLAESYSVYVKDSIRRGTIKNTDSLTGYYKTIFEHYKITPEEFTSSLEWYKNHPEALDSIYNKMIQAATPWQVKAPVAPPLLKPKKDTTINSKPDTIKKNRPDTTKKK